MFSHTNIKLGDFSLSKSIHGVRKSGKGVSDCVELTGINSNRYIYGKNVVYSCVSNSPEQSLDIVLNGHGDNGLKIGKILGCLITKDLIEYSKCIQFPIDKSKLESFLRVELDKLSIIWSYKILSKVGLDSNSFCSVVIDWKIYDNIRCSVYPITIDIGSCYSWRLYDSKLYEDSKDFSCDNKDMVLEWLNSNWGLDEIAPSIICSRFNLSTGLKLDYMDGVIPIWRYVKNVDKWDVVLDTRFKEFYKTMPDSHVLKSVFKLGGTQSLRNREKFLIEYNMGGSPYINLGNTVMGKTKELGVLPKYLNDSDRLISKLHIKVSDSVKKGEDCVTIICSDGFGDCITDNILKDSYEIGIDSKDYMDSLISGQLSKCSEGGLGWELLDGAPRHDDQCVLVCSLK